MCVPSVRHNSPSFFSLRKLCINKQIYFLFVSWAVGEIWPGISTENLEASFCQCHRIDKISEFIFCSFPSRRQHLGFTISVRYFAQDNSFLHNIMKSLSCHEWIIYLLKPNTGRHLYIRTTVSAAHLTLDRCNDYFAVISSLIWSRSWASAWD